MWPYFFIITRELQLKIIETLRMVYPAKKLQKELIEGKNQFGSY